MKPIYLIIILYIWKSIELASPTTDIDNDNEEEETNINNELDGNETDEDSACDELNRNSSWEKQIPIRDCHYRTHTHPRQQLMKKGERDTNTSEKFHFLAIFNIRYDLDFQEAGDRCSVRLHQEWLLDEKGPKDLDEYSYDRIWYDRMCNPFSYLECVPWEEVRTKKKANEAIGGAKKQEVKHNPHENHTHPGALPDKHNHLPPEQNAMKKMTDQKQSSQKGLIPPTKRPRDPNHSVLEYNDSGRDTSRMHRWYIGGRGPGKGRHKSGPGVQRVDPTKLGGIPQAIPDPRYPLDGVCVCSAFDPKYPDRKRPRFGMDFVEDELREDWCVSAPGGLCGRVYFPENVWPGQDFVISDHIGCPKRYLGQEYECVRWSLLTNQDGDNINWRKPDTFTATCEKKQEIAAGAVKVYPISHLMLLFVPTLKYVSY